MSWESLREQEFAAKVLESHRQQGRLAHTYLFSGASSAARKDLAEAFACALNDRKERVLGNPSAELERRIAGRNHPDVKWLGEDEKVRSLKIEEIRDIIGWSALKPYEEGYKVVILCEADRLTDEAQNALLKTLEEPPPQTVFCLLIESKDNLLETIRSRSFEIRLRPGRSQSPEETAAPPGFGQKKWDDYFDDYQGAPKNEVFELLDSLMTYFRSLLVKAGARPEAGYSKAWLETLDVLYETKEALDANANQKLALTRLSMRLKRLLPKSQMLKVE